MRLFCLNLVKRKLAKVVVGGIKYIRLVMNMGMVEWMKHIRLAMNMGIGGG